MTSCTSTRSTVNASGKVVSVGNHGSIGSAIQGYSYELCCEPVSPAQLAKRIAVIVNVALKNVLLTACFMKSSPT